MYCPFPVICNDSSNMKSKTAVDVVFDFTVNSPFILSSPDGNLASCSPLSSTTTTFEISNLNWLYSPSLSSASANSACVPSAFNFNKSYS